MTDIISYDFNTDLDFTTIDSVVESDIGNSKPQPNRLSIKGKNFTLKYTDGTQETLLDAKQRPIPELDIIVLNIAPTQTKGYYDANYTGTDEDDAKAPICYSSNGEAPDTTVLNPIHHNCKLCPKNQPNSGKDGMGKACKDSLVVAVMLSPEIKTKLVTPTTPVSLRLPVTSLIPFKKYAQDLKKALVSQGKLKSTQALPIECFITQIEFKALDDKGKPTAYPILQFSYKGVAQRDKIKDIQSIATSEEVMQIIGMDADSKSQHSTPTEAKLRIENGATTVAINPDDDIPQFEPHALPERKEQPKPQPQAKMSVTDQIAQQLANNSDIEAF